MATVIRIDGRLGKGAFVEAHAELHDLTKDGATVEVTRVIETLFACIAGGQPVNFNNFGTFQLADVVERDIETRETGGLSRVRPHKRITFVAAPRLHNIVNNYKEEPMTARKLAKGEMAGINEADAFVGE